MTIEENFQKAFRNKKKYFVFEGESTYLKKHLEKINRRVLREYYLSNHPNNWIEIIPLPPLVHVWKEFDSDFSVIHKYKDQGVINTGWNYTKCFNLLTKDLVEGYQSDYGNLDPPGRSLIDFYESHEQAMTVTVRYFHKIKPLDFINNPVDSLKIYEELLRKNAKFIFENSDTTIFREMISEIITTKSRGKKSVKLIIKDLENKGFKKDIDYILTDSGDLLDIRHGIDLIFINPQLYRKTSQIKTGKEILFGADSMDGGLSSYQYIRVKCDFTSVKDGYTTDYLMFRVKGRAYYFFNKDVILDGNIYHFDKYTTYTNNLVDLTFKKPILTI